MAELEHAFDLPPGQPFAEDATERAERRRDRLRTIGAQLARRGVHIVYMQHSCGFRAKRCLEFPRLGSPHARAGDDFVEADFDEPHAGGAHGVIVTIAMLARDDEFVRHRLGEGQLLHAAKVMPS